MATRNIFPFERLPAELRVQIYQYIFVCKLPIHIISTPERSPKGVRYPRENQTRSGRAEHVLGKSGTALMRANKSTHAEVLPVLYAQNHFVFPQEHPFRGFVRKAKSGIGLIRKITLRLDPEEYKSILHVPRMHVQPLRPFTDLRTFEWTLHGVILSRTYPSYRARNLDLIDPIVTFVSLVDSPDARRAQFAKPRFVTRAKPAKGGKRKSSYQTADEVLQAIKDVLERILLGRGVLKSMV
ncbi:hypothetical protein LTR15_000550 [Elasticomyces elasticus]|nr:hypothetical protein LTR15_000550 [Elasticomyces elasticus]